MEPARTAGARPAAGVEAHVGPVKDRGKVRGNGKVRVKVQAARRGKEEVRGREEVKEEAGDPVKADISNHMHLKSKIRRLTAMPGFNGMGPQAAGPMTGWGRGYCIGYLHQDSETDRRTGMGRRRGWRNCYYATGLPRWARWTQGRTLAGAVYAPTEKGDVSLDDLKEQVGYLEKALEQAKKQIQELEKQV